MNRFPHRVLAFVLLFSSLLVLGFFVGREDSAGSAIRISPRPATRGETDLPKRAVSRLKDVSNTKRFSSAPADLKNLSGKEFVESFPALEALAKRGDLDAVHALVSRLAPCVDYHAPSDEEIRASEESNYQRELDAVKALRARQIGLATDPRFSEESVLHAHEIALKAAFDERDVCTSLTPRQIEGRFDGIRIALERHDRQTILDAALPGGGSHGIERVRNAEQLNAIAQIERSELDALAASGDATALDRAAFAFGRGSTLLQRDAALAYAYAYAWTLTGSTENGWQTNEMKALMEDLASGQGLFPPLTSSEIDQARARGSSIFQNCCVARAHN